MKKILYVFAITILIDACSAPKFTYYFDRYSPKSTTSESSRIDLDGNIIQSSSLGLAMSIQNAVPMASVAERNYIQPIERATVSNVFYRNSIPIIITADRNKRRILKERKREEKTAMRITYVPDKNKNGFAVAGFISSIVGLFFFWPLCVLGFILSAVGLKSERRGLAMAGFIIGLIGAIFVWVTSNLT